MPGGGQGFEERVHLVGVPLVWIKLGGAAAPSIGAGAWWSTVGT